jgi:hypothetical protein
VPKPDVPQGKPILIYQVVSARDGAPEGTFVVRDYQARITDDAIVFDQTVGPGYRANLPVDMLDLGGGVANQFPLGRTPEEAIARAQAQTHRQYDVAERKLRELAHTSRNLAALQRRYR